MTVPGDVCDAVGLGGGEARSRGHGDGARAAGDWSRRRGTGDRDWMLLRGW